MSAAGSDTRERIMLNAQTAQLVCEKCGAPMDLLEGVPVLQSLQNHAIFECEWCGHIALVRKHEPPSSPSWVGSIASNCGVSYAVR
jgi:DNA-directed RNA polymerase subunit RPC12/RpoP